MNKKSKTTLVTVTVILAISLVFAVIATILHSNDNFETSSVESVTSQIDEESSVDLDTDISSNEAVTSSDITPQFTNAPEGYFDDALFIGDSRTVGLRDYGNIKGATFFASQGLSVYKIEKEEISVENLGNIKLLDLLKTKKYGKIYLMMGINELGYNFNTNVEKFSNLVNTIREEQPDAILFLGANMHVSKVMSDESSIYNNNRINAFNDEVKKLADGQNILYIDVNEIFDDAEGNLDAKYTYDKSHLLGRHYQTWTDWLSQKAIVKG